MRELMKLCNMFLSISLSLYIVTFLKLLRRKARAKFKHDPRADPYTFLDWLRAKTAG